MRRGGGIGLIVVVIAMAIVMILTMRAWVSVAPTAQQIMNPGTAGKAGSAKGAGKGKAQHAGVSVPDHGDAQAGEAVRSGVLPDLSDMKEGTDQHAKAVADAMKETDK